MRPGEWGWVDGWAIVYCLSGYKVDLEEWVWSGKRGVAGNRRIAIQCSVIGDEVVFRASLPKRGLANEATGRHYARVVAVSDKGTVPVGTDVGRTGISL